MGSALGAYIPGYIIFDIAYDSITSEGIPLFFGAALILIGTYSVINSCHGRKSGEFVKVAYS